MRSGARPRRLGTGAAVCLGASVLLSGAAATSASARVPRVGPPSIVTMASPNTAIGGQLTDQAIISGLDSSVTTGTVTFKLYGPFDPTCAGPAVHTSLVAADYQSGGTASVTSDAYTPITNGVYHWIASYSTAANGPSVSGACGDASETVLVGDAFPPIPQQPLPPPPPPPRLPDIAAFSDSPKTLRVSKRGGFTYHFYATPGRRGRAKAASATSIRIGPRKRRVKVAAKSFTVPPGAVVTVNFKLSRRDLKALRAHRSLRLVVRVTVGAKTFSAKLTLKPPKAH
jgi:hypothetical protein